MPHKFTVTRRHKFAKKRYRVTNLAEYNDPDHYLGVPKSGRFHYVELD